MHQHTGTGAAPSATPPAPPAAPPGLAPPLSGAGGPPLDGAAGAVPFPLLWAGEQGSVCVWEDAVGRGSSLYCGRENRVVYVKLDGRVVHIWGGEGLFPLLGAGEQGGGCVWVYGW